MSSSSSKFLLRRDEDDDDVDEEEEATEHDVKRYIYKQESAMLFKILRKKKLKAQSKNKICSLIEAEVDEDGSFLLCRDRIGESWGEIDADDAVSC